MYTIHNLSVSDIIKLKRDDDYFIHISQITNEMLLDTENLLLFSRKEITRENDKIKIINFEKSSLIHELNNKYAEFFPQLKIQVSLSKEEEEAFIVKTTNFTTTITENSRLKINLQKNLIILDVIRDDLSYAQENLSLERFYNEGFNYKALQVELSMNKFPIKAAQLIQFYRDEQTYNHMYNLN